MVSQFYIKNSFSFFPKVNSLFKFGHLFLSIFENRKYFWEFHILYFLSLINFQKAKYKMFYKLNICFVNSNFLCNVTNNFILFFGIIVSLATHCFYYQIIIFIRVSGITIGTFGIFCSEFF
mgnify:CR=1 FL=1